MASMLWRRRSRNEADRLEVCLADPENDKSPFVVLHQGRFSDSMRKTSEVQKYIRNFYENLLYNGSDAPDDVFVDSLKSVAANKRVSKTESK